MLIVAEENFRFKHPEVIADIKDCISSGATGGEIISRVGKYLKDLEFSNKNAYLIIEDSIKNYLEICKNNGIIIN